MEEDMLKEIQNMKRSMGVDEEERMMEIERREL